MKSLNLTSLYLTAYNVAAMVGWFMVLKNVVHHYRANDSAQVLWADVGSLLTIVQTSAALEMVHSLLRLVRSPFMGTFLQVMSRLFLIHVVTLRSTEAQAHWSLYLMVASWSCVEIPRYAFYTFAQFLESKDIPALLFNLRYSLFMVLYPTGISGEMIQMLMVAASLAKGTAEGFHVYGLDGPVLSTAFSYRLVSFTFLGYLVGGPYMWMNMYGQRKRATKNRKKSLASANAAPKKKVEGIQWPVTDENTGARSSLVTNKKIWTSAFEGLKDDDESNSSVDALLLKLKKVKNWRRDYKKWVNISVVEGCKRPSNATGMARAGLEEASNSFTFVNKDGSVESLYDAVKKGHDAKECPYWTYVVEGDLREDFKQGEIAVEYAGKSGAPYFNYKNKEQRLTGDALKQQLQQWVDYGTIEQDACDAVTLCIDQPEKYCNLMDHTFVILGATSAMGPIDVLLRYGCTVVAIDIDREPTWNFLLNKVKSSPGRLIMPVHKSKLSGGITTQQEATAAMDKMIMTPNPKKKGSFRWVGPVVSELAKYTGCNIFTDVPIISRWLKELLVLPFMISNNKKLTIGNYTYLDGELHVRLSIACNAIITHLCNDNDYTKVAFLCTPTDCHVIPKAAYEAAKENYNNRTLFQSLFGGLLGLKPNLMKPIESEDGHTYYTVDGIVPQQGPNYALAKRMQHWMAIVQRAESHTVCTNVAPSTATISVTSNKLFEMAYGGMHNFKPMEVMWPCTSNALMGAVLLHDMNNEKGPKRGAKSVSESDDHYNNPLELFSTQGVHGGLWRTGYALNSTSLASVLFFVFANYHYIVYPLLLFLITSFTWLLGVLPSVTAEWDPLVTTFGWLYKYL